MPLTVVDTINYIKHFSKRGIFVIFILTVDLSVNWFLFSRNFLLPSVKQCSSEFPEFEESVNSSKFILDNSISAEKFKIYYHDSTWSNKKELQKCFCSTKICIRKCCSVGEAFNRQYECIHNFTNYSFIQKLRIPDISKLSNNSYLYFMFDNKCVLSFTKTKVASNISLLKNEETENLPFQSDQTKNCFEVVVDFDKPHEEPKLIDISCPQDVQYSINSLRLIVAHILRASATTIHILTFGVYAFIPSMCQGFGQCLMWLAGAMSLKGLFNMMVIAGFGQQTFFLCAGIGLGLQFFWLSSQMWQIVIAYQIWSAFKPGALNPSRTNKVKHYSRCRMFAWGLPLLASTLTLIADLTSFIPDVVKPQLGIKKCWFPSETRKFIYVVALVDCTEIVLLILCVATLLRLRNCQKDSKDIRSSISTKDTQNLKWNKVYVRVCFIMGSAYCFVTVTNLITWNYKIMYGIPEFLVRTVVDIERVRGVEIFFIFIFKKKTMMLLFQRFKNIYPLNDST